jgi:LuxR family maltose regulon positive regulatory protein
MNGPLLQTKLYIPPIRAELVPRPRLIDRLNEGFRHKLTLISAPAGFGKTTLLSEWVHGKDAVNPHVSVAWISLDEGDNDPARFWAYVVAALQNIEVRQETANHAGTATQHLRPIGEAVLGAFQAPQPPSIESLLTTLINEITSALGTPSTVGQSPDNGASERGIVLVLDDYHLIDARPIHSGLAFLLEHLPANMHLVIATRSDPPLHLARLRGHGQLVELRQTDLRFTCNEVAAFLNRIMGLELTAEDVSALASRTEGWVAGLQMAALALCGQSPALPAVGQTGANASVEGGQKAALTTAQFIRDFTGSNRYVLDYLVEEVLNCQPIGTQDFLLKTSILDRLCGPLCDAVRSARVNVANQGDGPGVCFSNEPVSGQAVLEQLERANLFIVPLDNERRWYRYHHLFTDLLRQRLQQVYPELVPTLHRLAGEWYERNGLTAPAIDHAFSAGDFERATHLIERAAEATFARGEFVTFLKWLDRLPDQEVRARPLLSAYYAWVLLFGGRPIDEIEARLQDAEQGDTAGVNSGEVALLRASLAMLKGDLQLSVELSQRALELLPEDNLFFRSLVARNLGATYMLIGDVAATIQAFDEAERISHKAGDLLGAVAALHYLAEMRMVQGQLNEARALFERALELGVDSKGCPLPVAVKVLAGLAELLRQWNDLEAATRHLLEAIELAEKWSGAWSLGGYVVLSRVRQAQGDVDGAREAIQAARHIAREFDASDIDDISVIAYQARLWVAQGDLGAAARWVEERGLDSDASSGVLAEGVGAGVVPYYLREIEHLTLARVYYAQGRQDEALTVLNPLLQAAERLERTGSVIEILALQALALHAQGNVAQALAVLQRALYLAEPEGYVRVFVDEGEPMAHLLYEAAARGVAPVYISKLLAAVPDLQSVPTARSQVRDGQFGIVETLSDRELQVLQLIAEGLSNQEIAQRLYLSLHTVKWHAGNIFGKLGVKNRARAVAKARALGVLLTA